MAAITLMLFVLLAVVRFAKVEVICYDTFGKGLPKRCFLHGDEASKKYEVLRPINPTPFNPNEMNNTFTAFKFHGYGEDMTEEQITVDHLGEWKRFHADNEIAIILHDFLDFPEDGPFGQHWIFRMKDILLHDIYYTVIVLNWKHGSGLPYSQAVANTQVVAWELYYLIQALQSVHAVELENIHLIGHGLGAHIAGMASKEFLGRIGRITGLDPAKLYYENMDYSLRLYRTAALFVDVIHTSTNYGLKELTGHYDFFPSGGSSQPGCKEEQEMYRERKKKLEEMNKTDGSLVRVRRADSEDDRENIAEKVLMNCNHRRAFKYFMESIATHCEFKGEIHSNWKDFEKQVIKLKNSYHCDSVNDKCSRMGFFSEQYRWLKQPKKSIRVFVAVNGMPPYCIPYR